MPKNEEIKVPVINIPKGYGRFAMNYDENMNAGVVFLMASDNYHEPGIVDSNPEPISELNPVIGIVVHSSESAKAYIAAFEKLYYILVLKENE